MKDSRKYSDAATNAFIGWVGVIVTTIVVLLITYLPGCSEFNQEIKEKLKNDPRPKSHLYNYLPPSFYKELDTLENNLDSLDERLDKLLKLEEIIDSLIESTYLEITPDCNEMHYLDEDVMWIGGDGDTIWE